MSSIDYYVVIYCDDPSHETKTCTVATFEHRSPPLVDEARWMDEPLARPRADERRRGLNLNLDRDHRIRRQIVDDQIHEPDWQDPDQPDPMTVRYRSKMQCGLCGPHSSPSRPATNGCSLCSTS